MLMLFDTLVGFALFRVLDEQKLNKTEDWWKEFATSDSVRKVVELKAFKKFKNASEALSAATLLIDGKPSKVLRKFLRAHCDGETLAVADTKLGNAIKKKLKIDCLPNDATAELMRGLRSQLTELIAGQDLAPMSLGSSQTLARYKPSFSPHKADTMVIKAIGLLDDLDRQLNTYVMRVCEWYDLHFPELATIIQDNIQYVKTVKLMGNRVNAVNLDFSEILPEEVEAKLKKTALISMGTQFSDLDLADIRELCDQVLAFLEYRPQLYDYMRNRMNTIAPNLTALVGELVGARLIAHRGSLLNLAKLPGSMICGEKALFKALKRKQATPKHGLAFHASLIGRAAPKNKAKISRSLDAKIALASRYDAFGESDDNSLGLEYRAKLEAYLRVLEGRELSRSAEVPNNGIENQDQAAAVAEDELDPNTEEKKKKKKRQYAKAEDRDPQRKEHEAVGTGKKKVKNDKREENKNQAAVAEDELEPNTEEKKKKKRKHAKTVGQDLQRKEREAAGTGREGDEEEER